MKSKKFTYILLIVFFSIVLINYLVFKTWYNPKLNNEYGNDLGRMIKINLPNNYNNIFENITLKEKFVINNDIFRSDIEILTIGDSFSQQDLLGYQNYLGKKLDKEILNVSVYKGYSPIETLNWMLDIGYFDNKEIKYVILENVERYAAQRALKISNINLGINDFQSYYLKLREKTHKINNQKFINIGNIKKLYYKIAYKFSENAFISPVYITNLTKEFFSENNRKLLFYYEDLENIELNQNNIKKINKNLNILAEKIQNRGMKLIVFYAPNKYTLYSSYILNSKYPQNFFFEGLSKEEKNYLYLDSKEILDKKIKNGDKDIYYLNDTHWSPKAAKIIGESLGELIEK